MKTPKGEFKIIDGKKIIEIRANNNGVFINRQNDRKFMKTSIWKGFHENIKEAIEHGCTTLMILFENSPFTTFIYGEMRETEILWYAVKEESEYWSDENSADFFKRFEFKYYENHPFNLE
jgi:hypothetical protein